MPWAYRSLSENSQNPEAPENPEDPENPENRENRENPESLANPRKQGATRRPASACGRRPSPGDDVRPTG
ncbi:hypothetical protein GCM10009548_00260 [Streptomyces malaysiensis subsp. malaysiensis]